MNVEHRRDGSSQRSSRWKTIYSTVERNMKASPMGLEEKVDERIDNLGTVAPPWHVEEQVSLENDEDDSSNDSSKPVARGGVIIPFPQKLHVMLDEAEDENFCGIVSWQPHGRAFMVLKPEEFVRDVMPTYFKQTKFASFQRQLNLYGFQRFTTGPDKGAYYHEVFLRGRLLLCGSMARTKIKGTRVRKAIKPGSDPDFYKLPFMPTLSSKRKKLIETPTSSHVKKEDQTSTTQTTRPSSERARASTIATQPTPTLAPLQRLPPPNKINTKVLLHVKHSPQSGVLPSRTPSEDLHDLVYPPTPPLLPEQQVSFDTTKNNNYRSPAPFVTPDYEKSCIFRKGNEDRCGDILFFEGKPFHYLDHGYGVQNVLSHRVPLD